MPPSRGSVYQDGHQVSQLHPQAHLTTPVLVAGGPLWVLGGLRRPSEAEFLFFALGGVWGRRSWDHCRPGCPGGDSWAIRGHCGACDWLMLCDAALEEIILLRIGPRCPEETEGFSFTKMTLIQSRRKPEKA